MRERARGFTLVELMIVVAIIALIATIGFPTYRDSVQKSKRAEAKSRLLQIAQLQERYFTQNNTYTTSLTTLLNLTGSYGIGFIVCGVPALLVGIQLLRRSAAAKS